MECQRGLATRQVSVRPSIYLSVCLSNACIVTKRKKDLSRFFIPYERSFSLVFWDEWLVGATPSIWNFASTGPRWSEIADFEPIFARSASAVTPSEKSSINTRIIGTPLRAFQWVWDDHRTLPLIQSNRMRYDGRRWSLFAPKGGLKNAKRPISI